MLGMYNLDKRNGNTGTLGRYFWRIEDQERDSDIKKCTDWIAFQDDVNFRSWYDQQFRSRRANRRLACPCTIWQAFLDRGRFSLDFSHSSSNFCFRSRRSRIFVHFSNDLGLVLFRLRQLCCYSSSFSDFSALITGPPDGSHAIAEPIFGASGVITDRDAETFCCADPDLCNLYYFYRPSDDCSFYRPRRRRKLFFVVRLLSLNKDILISALAERRVTRLLCLYLQPAKKCLKSLETKMLRRYNATTTTGAT